MNQKIVCIGGGAASFFFCANASALHKNYKFTIVEQGKNFLQKVKISGGGRCNVTHACFEPTELVKNYPRGDKELLGPFYGFGPEQTIDWFESRGVALKTEEDGRMFPITNSSQTIIDCLLANCDQNNVELLTSHKVKQIIPIDDGYKGYKLILAGNEILIADKLFIGAGSSKSIWKMLENLGVNIIPQVPSLFTFKINDNRLKDIPGISVPNVKAYIKNGSYSSEGPILITHKGLSGPSVLKLSAFEAVSLAKTNYKAKLIVNFQPELTFNDLKQIRDNHAKHLLNNYKLFNLPKRLFTSLLSYSTLNPTLKYASASNKELEILFKMITIAEFEINGQNTFKDEFVTAGGVDLKEVNFTNFTLKKHPNILIAGESLNIDAVTGGFNFQNAWTGAYLAAVSL